MRPLVGHQISRGEPEKHTQRSDTSWTQFIILIYLFTHTHNKNDERKRGRVFVKWGGGSTKKGW